MNDEAPKSEPLPTEARSFVAKVKAVGGLIGNLTALVAALAALTKSCQHDAKIDDLHKDVKATAGLVFETQEKVAALEGVQVDIGKIATILDPVPAMTAAAAQAVAVAAPPPVKPRKVAPELRAAQGAATAEERLYTPAAPMSTAPVMSASPP